MRWFKKGMRVLSTSLALAVMIQVVAGFADAVRRDSVASHTDLGQFLVHHPEFSLIGTAKAEDISLGDLDDKAKAKVLQALGEAKDQMARAKQAAQDAAQAAKEDPASVMEKAKQYADMGRTVGIAIGAAAKEVGMAVNDFAKTDVGRIAIVLIVWKLVGAALMTKLVIIGWWALASFSLWYLFKKIVLTRVEVTDGKGTVRYVSAFNYDAYKDADGKIGWSIVLFLLFVVLNIVGIVVIT